MESKDSHIVIVIGSTYKGSLALTRKDYPHLDVCARHGDLACLHCGGYFPLSAILPQNVDMINVITKQFRKEHSRCKKGKISSFVLQGKAPTQEEIDACLKADDEKND